MTFPKAILFGAASSAYQVEGAWKEDGKGENIWDRLVHTKPDTIENEDNGDIACDSYHLYKKDIALLKNCGFDVYRFSLSWTRILPDGEITNINKAGIDYYNNLINELLQNNIQPLVTIYHWDLPQKLQDLGGWVNPLIADYFEDYADLVFQTFGDRVKWWITINEPARIAEGYQTENSAPALNLRSPADYIVVHNLLRSHGKVYQLYDKKYRAEQNGKISITIDSFHYSPKTDSKEDREAANRAYQFVLGIFAHVIYTEDNDYPEIVRQLVDKNSKEEGRRRSRLPSFTDEEKRSLKGASDFFAVNHYTTYLCAPGNPSGNMPFSKDVNVETSVDEKWPSSHADWLKVVPWGIREQLKFIKENYNDPPIFITENGYCDKGQLDDQDRINYHRDYLKEVLNAINTYGCNVIGYTAWSFLDDFEWTGGYQFKFGLVHVDFKDPNRKRTTKSSYEFFKKFLQNRVLPCNICDTGHNLPAREG